MVSVPAVGESEIVLGGENGGSVRVLPGHSIIEAWGKGRRNKQEGF